MASTESMHLSVIVPAFNEAERITPTLRAISAWLTAQSYPSEILVVDDGSTDATCAVVRALISELPAISLIESTPNRGKGFAVRVGMLAARGAVRLYMDADNATPISELPKLARELERGSDIAIGSRRAQGGAQVIEQPWYRRAWSRVANHVVQAVLLDGIADTQCGFKLFTRTATEAIFSRTKTFGWGFDLEVLVLARKLGFSIVERGVEWSDDRRSRIHPLRDAIRITGELLQVRRALRRGDYDLR